eukprot:SAG31_NODE_10729_length_1104_cov_1.480597_2_plen_166_part_01
MNSASTGLGLKEFVAWVDSIDRAGASTDGASRSTRHQTDPDSHTALKNAERVFSNGNVTDAIRLFTVAAGMAARCGDIVTEAGCFGGRAQAYAQCERYTLAIVDYERAIELDPHNNKQARLRRALALESTGSINSLELALEAVTDLLSEPLLDRKFLGQVSAARRR